MGYSQFKYGFRDTIVIIKEKGRNFVELLMNGYNEKDFEKFDETGEMTKWYNKVKSELEKHEEIIEQKQGYGFEDVKLIIGNDCLLKIEPESFEAKFYDDLLFAIAMSVVMEEGEIELDFEREDGEKLQFLVTPNNVTVEFLVNVSKSEYDLYQKWKPYILILEEISKKEKIEIGENGVGTHFCKLQKENEKSLKTAIRYLFSDLATDLGIAIDKQQFDVIYG